MYLSENNINYMFNREFLMEDQESDSIKKAIALYMYRRNVDKATAEKWVREELRMMFPSLRNKRGGKFILGVTRFCLNGEESGKIQIINDVINYISQKRDGGRDDYYNQFDKNFNGYSAESLIEKFSDKIEEKVPNEEIDNATQKLNDEYEVISISSFDEASQFSRYTSWCITQYEKYFNTYSKNNTCQFYFCLKHGFENVKKEPGENCPLDEYGLSMLAISVYPNGNLKSCTCRWNHDNNGDDNIMSEAQISNLLHCNFRNVFIPNNNLKLEFEDLKQKLAQGDIKFEYVKEIVNSDGCKKAVFNDMWVLLNSNNEILIDEFFSDVASVTEIGMIICVKDGVKYYVSTEGEIYTLREVLNYTVQRINEYIEKGEEVPMSLFTRTFKSYNGDIRCYVFGYTNILRDGKLLFKKFYSSIDTLYDRELPYYIVKFHSFDEVKFLIDTDENDILGRGYKHISPNVQEGEYIKVETEKGFNIVSINNGTKFLSKLFFKTEPFYFPDEKYCISGIPKNATSNEMNLFTLNGDKLCNDMDFDHISNVYNDVCFYVEKDKQVNFLSKKGKILSPDLWFDRVEETYHITNDGFNICARVLNDRKYNYFSFETNSLISPIWFDDATFFGFNNIGEVQLNGKKNVINTNGEFLLDTWMDGVEVISDNTIIVHEQNKGYNVLTLPSKWLSQDWLYDVKHDGNINLVIKKNEDSEEFVVSKYAVYRYEL